MSMALPQGLTGPWGELNKAFTLRDIEKLSVVGSDKDQACLSKLSIVVLALSLS